MGIKLNKEQVQLGRQMLKDRGYTPPKQQNINSGKKITDIVGLEEQTDIKVPKKSGIEEIEAYKEKQEGDANVKAAKQAPFISSYATVATAPFRAVSSLSAAAKDSISAATGRKINTNDANHKMTNMSDDIRKTVGDTYASKWFGGDKKVFGQNLGTFLYNAGMSAADNVVMTLAGQGIVGAAGVTGEAATKATSKIVSALMSSDSAASSIIENKERGIDDKHAVMTGLASGAIEYLTEKYSLEQIMKEPKTLFQGLIKSFAAEGSEEITSDVAGKIADQIINGDDSQISQNIKNYKDSGYTNKEAVKNALFDSVNETLAAGLAGGISGAAISAGYHGVNAVGATKSGKLIKSGKGDVSVDSLVDYAKQSDDTGISKRAEKVSAVIEKGKTPSAYSVGKLYNDVAVKQVNEIAKQKSDFAALSDYRKNLINKGYTESNALVQTKAVYDSFAAVSQNKKDISFADFARNFENYNSLTDSAFRYNVGDVKQSLKSNAAVANFISSDSASVTADVLSSYVDDFVNVLETQHPETYSRLVSELSDDAALKNALYDYVTKGDVPQNSAVAETVSTAGDRLKNIVSVGLKSANKLHEKYNGKNKTLSTQVNEIIHNDYSSLNNTKYVPTAYFTSEFNTNTVGGSAVNNSNTAGEGFTDTKTESSAWNSVNENVSEKKTNSKKTTELFKKLIDSIPLLMNDAVVYTATGKEFEVGEKKLSQQVYEYFENLGGVVHREGFGDVAINDKGVDSSIAHGIGRAKAIAFASVPAVIEKGRQIDYVENWKGRNYDSYVFAAPIRIGTQKAFVGVVVTKSDTDNRYYLHEVSDSEGNIIIIKKDDASFKSKSEATDNSSSLGETSSTDSVAQDSKIVNTYDTQNSRNNSAASENFIDNRNIDEVGKKSVKAFQYEYPQIKPFYREMAQGLKNDIKMTVRGEKFVVDNPDVAGQKEWSGTKRHTSDAIAEIKDTFDVSYAQIDDALDRIINDDGQENVALAKRIEIVIDDMLTKGYTDIEGRRIEPNAEYIKTKAAIKGTDGSEYSNRYDGWLDDMYSDGTDNSGSVVVAHRPDGTPITLPESTDTSVDTLSRTDNKYSAFEGAKRIVYGNDLFVTSNIAVPLNNESAQAIERIAQADRDSGINNEIDFDRSFSLANIYDGSNDVLLSGSPKVYDDAYVFAADGKFYACNQALLDSLVTDDTVILANSNPDEWWNVYEDGKLKAIIPPVAVPNMDNELFDSLKSVSDVRAETEPRFSMSDSFADEYDSWLNRGGNYRTTLTVGRTSKALKSIGVEDKRITWDTAKINKIKNKHSVDDAVIKQVPYILENPVIIMRSVQKDTRLTMCGEVYDLNNHPVMAVIELNPTNAKGEIMLDEIKLVSAYGKDNLQGLINKSDILYVDSNKKRTDDWLTQNRLQLPLGQTNHRYNNSISQNAATVNSKYTRNSDNYAEIKSQEWSQSRGLQLPKLADTNPVNNNILYKEDIVNSNYMPNNEIYSNNTKGVNQNEQNQRNDILSGDGRRSGYESAGEQNTRVQKTQRENQTGNETQRRAIAEQLRQNGHTSRLIDARSRFDVIDDAHLTDDMRAVKAENSRRGLNTYFFVGRGEYAFDTANAVNIDGCINGNNVYLRYDGTYTPEQLNKHELVHKDYNTDAVVALREEILGPLSEDEKQDILSLPRYRHYLDVYGGNENLVWEEFVADTLAGMNNYSAEFESRSSAYWNAEQTVNQGYSPSTFAESIDTGKSVSDSPVRRLSAEQGAPQTLRLPPKEYALVSRAVMAKNAGLTDAELKPVNYVFAADECYLYVNNSLGDFSIIRKIDPVTEMALIENVKENIDNGTYTESEGFDRRIYDARSGQRDYSSTGSKLENRGTTVAYDRLYRGESDGNSVGYTSEVRGDKSSGIKLSVSTDGQHDLLAAYDDAKRKYGTFNQGENPVRVVSVPRQIDDDRHVNRFARTIMESEVTPDNSISDFERDIMDGKMAHEVITDKKAAKDAVDKIKKEGFEGAMNSWDVFVRSDKVGKKDFALGLELYNQCITNKDTQRAMKLAAELSAISTAAGQTVQAARMLKKMSPSGQLYYLTVSVDQINNEFKNKLGDKFKDVVIDDEIMQRFLDAPNETERTKIYDELCQNIADQIPATKLEKWNAWRYLAMLGNPRTHIRNIVGNAVFLPAQRLSNYVGAVIEKAMNADESERRYSASKSKKAVDFAKADFEKMQKRLQGVNDKYAVTSDIGEKRRIFNNNILETARKKNFDLLEKEDMIFLKVHYVDALARIIMSQNIDVNNIDAETLESIRQHAVKVAKAATYRDNNALAEFISSAQRRAERSDNRLLRATAVGMESVMPFKKTPLNIAKQGVIYSPVGLMNGVYKLLRNLHDGSASTAEVVDALSKGLVGTALTMLGLFLASKGLLRGGDDEEKKKRDFDTLLGKQSFSFVIGDNSYTIDWMVPSALPLFVGCELFNLTKDEFKVRDVAEALSKLSNPLLELSVFSGISDLISSAQYRGTQALTAVTTDMAMSYVLQAFPTLGGQFARIIDGSRREYYYNNKQNQLPKGLQQLFGRIAAKIPFAGMLIGYEKSVDDWGRDKTYGSLPERVFENTVSPGYYSKYNYTEVDRELERLYEAAGETEVLPRSQGKTVVSDKVAYDLTPEEYAKVKRLRGQKSYELIKELISSTKYKNMSDDDRVKTIKKCYDSAYKYAKEQTLDSIKNSRE